MPEPLLQLDDVEARYGPVKALHGVSLTVGEGEVVAVLGANGAGKTTTLRAISGTVRRDGELRFAGKRLGKHRAVIGMIALAEPQAGDAMSARFARFSRHFA